MSGKFALIIGNTEYIDPGLAQLTAPGKDAEDFARVLKDREIGAFDNVNILVNEPSASVIEAIDEFFDQKKPDDMLVLYFSGHGIRDEIGSLYLAFKNTLRSRLRSTAIKSDYIKEAMDQSRSKRQVLILDCCNSGAFPQGTKAELGGAMGMTKAFQGYGRFVLTASDATQFAWEGDKVIGDTDNSLFTHFLVKGLEGEADSDGDGKITVDELYEYAFDQISRVTPKQTPTKSSSKQEGEIVLRQSTRIEDIKPVPLSAELIDEIEDTRPYVREAAVQKLDKIIQGRNIGLARSAREALEKIVADENTTRRVFEAATQILASIRHTEQFAPQKKGEVQKTRETEDAKHIAMQKEGARQLVHKRAEETERKVSSSVVVEKKVQDKKQHGQLDKRTIPFLGGIAVILILGATVGLVIWRSYLSPRQTEVPTNAVPLAPALQNTGLPATISIQATSVATNANTPSAIDGSLTQAIITATLQDTSTATNISIVLTSAPSSLSEGDQRPNSKDGAIIIYIPPGEFTMGLTDPKKYKLCPAQNCDQIYQASQPAHKVTIIHGYWIYRTEVSNAQYAKCVASRNCESPRSSKSGNLESYYGNSAFNNYPVVWVDWDRANKYCLWSGGRLPTSAEWEYAARKNDERLFPWGDDFPKDASQANVNDFFGNTKPVDELVTYASPFGLLNMTGNVWEWVSDWYSLSYYQDNNNWIDPKGPASGDSKVGRGGSWAHSSAVTSVAIQDWEIPNSSDINYNYDGVGFRCVIDQP